MLIPVIVLFSVVGSYSLSHSMFSVLTMLSFGFLGFLMRKIDMPQAPMILSLILGPFAETGFRQALILSQGDLLSYLLKSPISLKPCRSTGCRKIISSRQTMAAAEIFSSKRRQNPFLAISFINGPKRSKKWLRQPGA